MLDTEKTRKKSFFDFADYSLEIDALVEAENERIERILRRIDESMAAIHESKKKFGFYNI
jgi:hypothetical protein